MQYFLPISGFCFHWFNSVFGSVEVFHINEVQVTDFFFMTHAFDKIRKSLPKPRLYAITHAISRGFTVLHFRFMFRVHCELIFVEGISSMLILNFCLWVYFLHSSAFAHLSKIDWLYVYPYISEFYLLPHWTNCLCFHPRHSLNISADLKSNIAIWY